MLLHVLDIASTHWQWVVKVDGKPYSKPMIVRKKSLEGTKWQITKIGKRMKQVTVGGFHSSG